MKNTFFLLLFTVYGPANLQAQAHSQWLQGVHLAQLHGYDWAQTTNENRELHLSAFDQQNLLAELDVQLQQQGLEKQTSPDLLASFSVNVHKQVVRTEAPVFSPPHAYMGINGWGGVYRGYAPGRYRGMAERQRTDRYEDLVLELRSARTGELIWQGVAQMPAQPSNMGWVWQKEARKLGHLLGKDLRRSR